MTYDIYSAFGNETRIKLLQCLSRHPKNVTELIQHCGLAQSAVSQHLSKLKKAKLVTAKKVGKEVLYILKYKKAATISALVQSLEKEIV